MKYVFISLLLANLAYAAWQWLRAPEAQAPVTSSALAGVPPVTLLRELPAEQLEAMVREALTRETEPEVEVCLALGPLMDARDAEAMVARLVAREHAVRLVALDSRLDTRDYRVMIPPVASMEAAFRQLRELQAREIDSYVIARGRNRMAISLGVFSNEITALNAQAALERQGYATVISEIARSAREYWITGSRDTITGLLANDPDGEVAALSVGEISCEQSQRFVAPQE